MPNECSLQWSRRAGTGRVQPPPIGMQPRERGSGRRGGCTPASGSGWAGHQEWARLQVDNLLWSLKISEEPPKDSSALCPASGERAGSQQGGWTFLFLYPFLLLWRSCPYLYGMGPTPVCLLLSTKSHAQHTSVAIDSLNVTAEVLFPSFTANPFPSTHSPSIFPRKSRIEHLSHPQLALSASFRAL